MNKKKLIIICFSLLLMFPFVTNATSFVPNVSIGNFIAGEESTIDGNSIGYYIKAIYEYLSSIIGLVAAVALVIGGVMWLTAGGSSQRVSQAKSWISGSLTGLVLVLLSWLILQTINPNLVSFTSLDIKKIEPAVLGCCHYTNDYNYDVAMDTTDSECYQIVTNEDRVNDPIPTITEKKLDEDYDGKISEYVKDYFDEDKNAVPSEGVCKELGYEFHYIQNERDNKIIGRTAEGSMTFSHNGVTSKFISRGDFEEKEDDPVVDDARTTWMEICQGVGDGGTCNFTLDIAVFFGEQSCYCYGGEPRLWEGKEGEICGNENSICIPDEVNGEDPCEDWDLNGRSCGSDLSCCKKKSIDTNIYWKF